MTRINPIKYLKQVQGFSYTKVMKITGHSYRTIRKYEEIENFNYTPIKRIKKTFKIDQYKEFLDKGLLSDIENKVGYFRRNLFVPILETSSILDYNKNLFRLCDTDNERIHYQKNKKIWIC